MWKSFQCHVRNIFIANIDFLQSHCGILSKVHWLVGWVVGLMVSHLVDYSLVIPLLTISGTRKKVLRTIRFEIQENTFFFFFFFFFFLGSGPNRGRSPVEWGDFLLVCSLVHSPIRPRAKEPARQALDPASQAS